MNESLETAFTAGFVSLVGRPNVGKSSLTNALAGEKVVITSSKPQTTRRAIRVIINTQNSQIVIVDTPGIHRPRTLLGQRLNELVDDTLEGVDVIGFCVPANEDVGPGDRFINEQLDDYPNAKKVAIVTKIDTVSKDRIFEQLAIVNELRNWDAVIPVSEKDENQLTELKQLFSQLLPKSPPLYDSETLTEESVETRITEFIREAALTGVRDELPHSIAVIIDDVITEDSAKPHYFASIILERESQKGIVIGHKGTRLKQIKKVAKSNIEKMLKQKISLSVHVKVLKDWQKDPKYLNRLGF